MFKERIILVFLISIILIAFCVRYLPKQGDKQVGFERFWVKKTHSGPNYDMLILGDSRAYRGVSPNEIEKIIPGIKVLNFGYSSGRLNRFIYKEAEKHFNSESNQKIILLAITPNTLTIAPVEDEQYLSQLTLPKEEIISRLYLSPFLKYFNPLSIKEIVLLYKGDTSKKENYVEEYFDNGWVASYKLKEDTTEALKSYREWFLKSKVSEKQIDDLITQTKLWVKSGIKVFALRPPTSYSMLMLEDSLSGFDENSLKYRFENVGGIWIETNTKEYHSYDGSHIHKDSAIELSQKIAIYIKNHI